MARILIVSDAWHPQVNGVVRTIEATVRELQRIGHAAEVIGPERFRTVPLRGYPEIRLAVLPRRRLAGMIAAFRPDVVHIATEGPLGWAARGFCLKRGIRYTTAYHTRFPEYLARRLPVPMWLSYILVRRFHNSAAAVLVTTPTMRDLLHRRGLKRLTLWTRGVDIAAFTPGKRAQAAVSVLLHVGRLAVEKNVEAFLKLDVAGTKVIVGDGPQAAMLRRKYPHCQFRGALFGEELAQAYRQADVMVFPSRTDTFGLVMVEALACGVPVAAYPVPGPLDVLAFQDETAPVGVMHPNLGEAVRRALDLRIPPARCREYVMQHFTWREATSQFAEAALP